MRCYPALAATPTLSEGSPEPMLSRLGETNAPVAALGRLILERLALILGGNLILLADSITGGHLLPGISAQATPTEGVREGSGSGHGNAAHPQPDRIPIRTRRYSWWEPMRRVFAIYRLQCLT